MKTKSIKNLVIQNIILLIPLIIYGIFKNGYLIYEKGFINIINIFKPLYLIFLSVVIKFIIDLVKYKKIKFDFNLLYVIIIPMIMPYNINYLVYIIGFTLMYIVSLFMEKYLKFNKVCFIYLVILLINSLFTEFTFNNILESKYNYSFTFLDLLIGRNIGGIASTSILFSLIYYIVLINSIYYKKDIPYTINLTYLFLMFIYYYFTHNNAYLLNSELIFGSIIVSTNPESSPGKVINQIFYGIFIGLISFIISIIFNSIISIYIATFLASLLNNIKIRQKLSKKVVA